jgi:hypothetical protein
MSNLYTFNVYYAVILIFLFCQAITALLFQLPLLILDFFSVLHRVNVWWLVFICFEKQNYTVLPNIIAFKENTY